jgi:hypothetical protein
MIERAHKHPMSMILAGLLAAAPACTATVEENDAVSAAADELKVSSIYTSNEYTIEVDEFDAVTRTYVTKSVRAKLKVTIARAGRKNVDYQYDGRGQMANEIKVEWVNAAGVTVRSSDDTYFAKATGKKGEFRLFNCSSTSRCMDESASATVKVSANDRTMVVSGLGLSTDNDGAISRVLLDDVLGRSVTLRK